MRLCVEHAMEAGDAVLLHNQKMPRTAGPSPPSSESCQLLVVLLRTYNCSQTPKLSRISSYCPHCLVAFARHKLQPFRIPSPTVPSRGTPLRWHHINLLRGENGGHQQADSDQARAAPVRKRARQRQDKRIIWIHERRRRCQSVPQVHASSDFCSFQPNQRQEGQIRGQDRHQVVHLRSHNSQQNRLLPRPPAKATRLAPCSRLQRPSGRTMTRRKMVAAVFKRPSSRYLREALRGQRARGHECL
ncbi:hypothetical protein B0T17DRAFT_535249 [Bombardia bombarda]|uniref:Uncharacterized protein n=1 Tax=Bombardia bombarda TaxID=252184 RepID=A0AA39WUT8_9PEZI|nr:hypothetical protein B0T17DRAFT_535249 [Bombardia bombarda]